MVIALLCVPGCVLPTEGDPVEDVTGRWTGVTTPIPMVDANGREVPALALVVWSGSPIPRRTLGLLDQEARNRKEAAPMEYILIYPGDTHGRLHTIVDTATVPAYRAVEVRGVMSEAGYGVNSPDRRRLGRISPPTIHTTVNEILVEDVRVLFPDQPVRDLDSERR
jgi:hypothetical protein